MLKCEDFQFLAGADPRHLTWGQRMHWLMCRTCARYLGSMRKLDRKIEEALKIELPRKHRDP